MGGSAGTSCHECPRSRRLPSPVSSRVLAMAAVRIDPLAVVDVVAGRPAAEFRRRGTLVEAATPATVEKCINVAAGAC